MDQLPTRIHLGKATRQIARLLIRFPQVKQLHRTTEASLLLSKHESDSIDAELYWFRLTALQLVLMMYIQQNQSTLNLYEARYMMATAIELAFQDADLSRRDTTKIRSKLSEEMDYYFRELRLSHGSGTTLVSEEVVNCFACRTLDLCTSVPDKGSKEPQRLLAKEATVIWDKVISEVDGLLQNITIIEFEK